VNPADPLPFEDVFAPFVSVARHRLRARMTDIDALVAASGLADLERDLLKTVTSLAGRPLQTAFSFHLFKEKPVADSMYASPREASPMNAQYVVFVDDLLSGGLARFFCEFPVLARLLGTAMLDWIEASVGFLLHFRSDRRAIRNMFGSGTDPGRVISARPGLSDRHRAGRTVIHVTFASGLTAIYKPRDVGMEAAFYRLVDWINGRNPPLDWKVLRVINRGSHGWIEYVRHSSCGSDEEVRRYFTRAGMLQCLMYVLCGTDGHMGNVIACGEHPILVDAECLCQPDAQRTGPPGQRDEILRTGILPRSAENSLAVTVDTSGIWGRGFQSAGFVVPKWKNVNTDDMSLRFVHAVIKPQANCVSRDGLPVVTGPYLAHFLEGFSTMCRYLLNHRALLLARRGPLARFEKRKVRILLRSTRTYFSILHRSLHPRYLRDGLARSALLARSIRTMAGPADHFAGARVHELRALARLDVPSFLLSATTGFRRSRAAPRGQSFATRLTTLDERRTRQHVRRLKAAWLLAMLSSAQEGAARRDTQARYARFTTSRSRLYAPQHLRVLERRKPHVEGDIQMAKTNISTLQAAGIIHRRHTLSDKEVAVIEKLTKAEIQTLKKVKQKLGVKLLRKTARGQRFPHPDSFAF
jgi:type 2 lantibiotic biosynthesis protein LanM